MISKDTALWIVVGIIILGGLFWLVQQRPVPVEEPSNNRSAELYLDALAVGREAANYRYSFAESVNGYPINTTLIVRGGNKYAEVILPFAREQFFFLENRTVLCVYFRDMAVCDDVQGEEDLQNVLTGVERAFFERLAIDQAVEHNRRLTERNVLQFVGEPQPATVNGYACSRITYRYDHTQLSLQDISALNINPRALPEFDGQWCVDDNGMVYEKIISYEINGQPQQTRWRLVDSDWNYGEEIVLPSNETNPDTVETHFRVQNLQTEMRSCYALDPDARERCLASFAVSRTLPAICDLAGGRRDLCYISLALRVGDESLCGPIADTDTKENCYLEVAGKNYDPTLCDRITNESKQQLCLNVSSAPVPEMETGGNETTEEPLANETGETFEDWIVNELD